MQVALPLSSPLLSSVHFSGRQRFYSSLPDSLLISFLFYSTVRWNGEQNDEPFSLLSISPSSLRQPFMFSSTTSTTSFPPILSLQQLHACTALFSLSSRLLSCDGSSYEHIDWAEPSSLKKNSVYETTDKNKRLSLFSFTHWDNQVLAESRVRLKGGCVEAESAGASALRGHLSPFESIQPSLHLLTCP